MNAYDPGKLEAYWQKKWESDRLYETNLRGAERPFYTHVMFPYPSGDKLHIGHWYNFGPADTYARFKSMQGNDVFSPMGFDAFGLPAENYAIKTGVHPSKSIAENVQTMIGQLKRMGCMYDWTKIVNTSDPDYYKWTQFVFLQMFKHNLAYKKETVVNWDPVDQTVVANEQVKPDGTAERSGAKVVKKPLEQWFFNIKNYAERLLGGLDELDWPEKTKVMQRNWIGRSEGINFVMKVKDLGVPIEVFDSIPQTFLAQTFTVIAADHPLVEKLIAGTEREREARAFVELLKKKAESPTGAFSGTPPPTASKQVDGSGLREEIAAFLERLQPGGLEDRQAAVGKEIEDLVDRLSGTTAPEYADLYKSIRGICESAGVSAKKHDIDIRVFATRLLEKKISAEVEGVFTGRYVENPFGTGDFPIWIASYVISEYGTGIVNCSGHDERDFAFAKKYGIPLKVVLLPDDKILAEKVSRFEAFYREPDGILTKPDEVKGTRWDAALEPIVAYIGEHKIGRKAVNYRLHDWCVSRQRYWGAPIPIVYDPQGIAHPIPEEHLPWLLPTDVDFKPTGVAPLARSQELAERVERLFGKGWTPETDTMDTFVCSSFYSYRYLAEGDAKRFVDPDIEEKWMPVDVYIGGAEHATKHLLYARFVTMALKDFGIVSHAEPYERLVHQGLITNRGAKMSKSHGNAVSPDPFVERYGADVFRMYLMFMGPFWQGGDWSDTGINGIDRFAKRTYACFSATDRLTKTPDDGETNRLLAETIKKVTEDLERLHFNTGISALMVLLNHLQAKDRISLRTAKAFVLMLAPLAPHLAEELWRNCLQQTDSVFKNRWPEYSADLLRHEQVEVPVQVNGRLRDRVTVPLNCDEQSLREIVLSAEGVRRAVPAGATVKKMIVVPNRMVNIVLNG